MSHPQTGCAAIEVVQIISKMFANLSHARFPMVISITSGKEGEGGRRMDGGGGKGKKH